MVIVRSTFVNGGAIVPIRWTSDARRQQQLLTRGYTTAKAEPPVSPSSKIKAREFRVRPHEAKKLLFEEALIATDAKKSPVLQWASGKLGGRFENGLNKYGYSGKSLEPVRFKAYYWPIWKFSALAETRSDSSKTTMRALVEIPDHVIPGSHLKPLSLLDLGNNPFEAHTVQTYNPSFHLNQFANKTPILAVPFSISPFDVIELARDMAPSRIRQWTNRAGGDEIWIDPKHDIRELLVAAYPVYHPVFVAEYNFVLSDRYPARSLVLVLDAYDTENGRPRVYRPNTLRHGLSNVLNKNHGYWENREEKRTNLDDPVLDFFGGDHKALLDIWLNPAASPRVSPARGQPLNTVDIDAPESPLAAVKIRQTLIPWEDPRIQEYGSQDFLANRAWVRLSRLNWIANSAKRNYESDLIQRAVRLKDRSIWKDREADPEYKRISESTEAVNNLWMAEKPAWLSKPGSLGKRKIKADPTGKFVRG